MKRKSTRPPLPPACALCRPYGGTHRNYGTPDVPRLARCDCARGKALGMGTKWGKLPKVKPPQPSTAAVPPPPRIPSWKDPASLWESNDE
jgi:hypothetical protein